MQERGRIINKFADLLEEHTDELAALDSCATDMLLMSCRSAELCRMTLAEVIRTDTEHLSM